MNWVIPCFGHSHLMALTSFSNWQVINAASSKQSGFSDAILEASLANINPLESKEQSYY